MYYTIWSPKGIPPVCSIHKTEEEAVSHAKGINMLDTDKLYIVKVIGEVFPKIVNEYKKN